MTRRTREMNEESRFKERYIKVKTFIQGFVSQKKGIGTIENREGMYDFIDLNFPDDLRAHPASFVARANSDLKYFYDKLSEKKIADRLDDSNLCLGKYLELTGEEMDFYSRCQSCNGYGVYTPISPEDNLNKKTLDVKFCDKFRRIKDMQEVSF